jgi:hypothetical protein
VVVVCSQPVALLLLGGWRLCAYIATIAEVKPSGYNLAAKSSNFLAAGVAKWLQI